jgi:hypothetical protein
LMMPPWTDFFKLRPPAPISNPSQLPFNESSGKRLKRGG